MMAYACQCADAKGCKQIHACRAPLLFSSRHHTDLDITFGAWVLARVVGHRSLTRPLSMRFQLIREGMTRRTSTQPWPRARSNSKFNRKAGRSPGHIPVACYRRYVHIAPASSGAWRYICQARTEALLVCLAESQPVDLGPLYIARSGNMVYKLEGACR